jgi:transcriptional regulator GlxA family with amidase domain
MLSFHGATSLLALLVLGVVAAQAAEPAPLRTPEGYTRNVAIVLYEGVELLDFAGPAEVFEAAGTRGASRGRDAFRVYTVAASTAPLTSQGFLEVTPDHTWADAPAPDVLVIPGGSTQNLVEDAKFLEWLRKTAPKAEVSMSVCTGAFAFAKLGLLDGATATTWYGAVDSLRRAAPKANVTDGRRFVDNGSIVTTAGVSAGIDGALHVVARLVGRRVADETARYMEYHWTPEAYLARTYSLFNPSLDAKGRRIEQGQVLESQNAYAEAADVYRAVVAEDPKDGFAWYRLGYSLQAAGQIEKGVEASRKAAEFSEVRSDALYNVACGYALQGKRDQALQSLEDAVSAGFRARWLLTSDPDLASVREDARFQKLLSSL